MNIFYTGRKRTIVLLDGAEATLNDAELQVPPNKESCKAQLRRVLQRLAEEGVVRNEEQFRHEDDGIFAVKARCGLRGYGWFQRLEKIGDAFLVSHFVMKKKQKVATADLDRAKNARKKIGEGDVP